MDKHITDMTEQRINLTDMNVMYAGWATIVPIVWWQIRITYRVIQITDLAIYSNSLSNNFGR